MQAKNRLTWSGSVLLGLAKTSQGVKYVRRPATDTTPEFDLAYVRYRPRRAGHAGPPALVIPGGPGLGSILPYRTLRKLASKQRLDLIMIEHRGVGLSRKDRLGNDLPLDAMKITHVIDDIIAVLDHESVAGVNVVGSSYGSYLASCFGVMYPDRVISMILDSALQSAHHLELERSAVRQLFWESAGARSQLIRRLSSTGIDQRVLLDVVRAAYELGGDALLLPLLRGRIRHGRNLVWRAVEAYATREASNSPIRGIYEFDLVGAIGFRELGYGGKPDGLPLDPALTYSQLSDRFPGFVGEPFNLLSAVSGFDWPLVLLCGSRDLRTPPAIAAEVAQLAPRATTVTITNGHSALDTHPVALLNVLRWVALGRQTALPTIENKLDELPKRGFAARLPTALRVASRFFSGWKGVGGMPGVSGTPIPTDANAPQS